MSLWQAEAEDAGLQIAAIHPLDTGVGPPALDPQLEGLPPVGAEVREDVGETRFPTGYGRRRRGGHRGGLGAGHDLLLVWAAGPQRFDTEPEALMQSLAGYQAKAARSRRGARTSVSQPERLRQVPQGTDGAHPCSLRVVELGAADLAPA